MFYSNNDNYMQDLYFYNQTPNNTYNPFMSANMNSTANNIMPNMNPPMVNNTMAIPNMNGMFMGTNNGMMPYQNLNNLYPSVYRIINPVVSRVVSNANNQMINEDLLNNMVDTVFNIVEGQLDFSDDTNQRNTQSENQMTSNSSSNTSSNSNNSSTTRTAENRQSATMQTSSRNNRNESLLRDLIKILILKELLLRNQCQRQFVSNPYMGQQFNMSI